MPLRPPYKPFKEAFRLKVVVLPFRVEKSLKGPYESLGDANDIETGRMRGLVVIRSMS